MLSEREFRMLQFNFFPWPQQFTPLTCLSLIILLSLGFILDAFVACWGSAYWTGLGWGKYADLDHVLLLPPDAIHWSSSAVEDTVPPDASTWTARGQRCLGLRDCPRAQEVYELDQLDRCQFVHLSTTSIYYWFMLYLKRCKRSPVLVIKLPVLKILDWNQCQCPSSSTAMASIRRHSPHLHPADAELILQLSEGGQKDVMIKIVVERFDGN